MKNKNALKALLLLIALSSLKIHAQTNTAWSTTNNIGIGTLSPQGKLHVNGSLFLSSATNSFHNSPGLIFVANDDFLYDGEYLNYYGLGAHLYNDGNGTTGTNTYLAGYYGLDFFSGGSNRLRINNNGNVGIGTVNPQGKLHVDGSIFLPTSYTNAALQSPGIAFIANQHFLYDGEYLNYYGLGAHLFNDGSTQEGTNTYLSGFYGIDFNTGGTERMRINTNGKVTIGITAKADFSTKTVESGCLLFVKGGILTEKIKVATYTTWADYVFASEYKLKTLIEVENFIQQNKHLPNIPSAKEVKDQGIDLADMQAKQMEKIEELTLYLIKQSKEIELLKTEVAVLKSKK